MSLHPEDKRAGFTGLIAGGLFVLAMVLGIVKFTNAQFAGHAAERAAGAAPAAQTGH
ncbi:MAG TPA: hypothetical protein VFX39_00510 [Gemmatimonadaceae bacterium]|nr:hypothetical protein [Gemmatimonadaceae bacterium]